MTVAEVFPLISRLPAETSEPMSMASAEVLSVIVTLPLLVTSPAVSMTVAEVFPLISRLPAETSEPMSMASAAVLSVMVTLPLLVTSPAVSMTVAEVFPLMFEAAGGNERTHVDGVCGRCCP